MGQTNCHGLVIVHLLITLYQTIQINLFVIHQVSRAMLIMSWLNEGAKR